jgi:hypothetical protein
VAVALPTAISRAEAPASTRAQPDTPAGSALVHRLDTCLPPGRAKPTVVLVHGAWADASSWRGEVNKLPPAQLFFTTPYPGAPKGASELYLKENIFIHHSGNGLPRTEAERLWAAQRGASTAAFDTPSKAAAWKTIPSWYFISTGDQIITAASEPREGRRQHSRGACPQTAGCWDNGADRLGVIGPGVGVEGAHPHRCQAQPGTHSGPPSDTCFTGHLRCL